MYMILHHCIESPTRAKRKTVSRSFQWLATEISSLFLFYCEIKVRSCARLNKFTDYSEAMSRKKGRWLIVGCLWSAVTTGTIWCSVSHYFDNSCDNLTSQLPIACTFELHLNCQNGQTFRVAVYFIRFEDFW